MNAADKIASKKTWVPPEIDAAISSKDIFEDLPSNALLKITLIGAIVTSRIIALKIDTPTSIKVFAKASLALGFKFSGFMVVPFWLGSLEVFV